MAAALSPKGWRITLTPLAILNSRAIVMLVAGADKAPAVASAIEGPLDVTRCPAQLMRESGRSGGVDSRRGGGKPPSAK